MRSEAGLCKTLAPAALGRDGGAPRSSPGEKIFARDGSYRVRSLLWRYPRPPPLVWREEEL